MKSFKNQTNKKLDFQIFEDSSFRVKISESQFKNYNLIFQGQEIKMENRILEENIQDDLQEVKEYLKGKKKLDNLNLRILENMDQIMDQDYPPGTDVDQLLTENVFRGISPKEFKEGLDFRGKR